MELKGNSRVEGELMATVFVSLLASFSMLGILYLVRLRSIDGFVENYGFFLFFSILAYAVLMPSVRQVRAFSRFPCMTGMMIGMTMGMVSGFPARLLRRSDQRHVLGKHVWHVCRNFHGRMERKMLRHYGSNGGPHVRIHGRAYGSHDRRNDGQ